MTYCERRAAAEEEEAERTVMHANCYFLLIGLDRELSPLIMVRDQGELLREAGSRERRS